MIKEADKDPQKHIIIKGSRVHNLKNLDVAIPKNKLVVVTGMSGSGKSSLAFDTLYAEGQRRYVESLSSYARQFLGRMNKPDVDYIKGIAPAIAIEQKVITSNPRSTVGTSTEIYDYLKLLFSRIGKTISPVSGGIVKKDSVTDVINFILSLPDDTQATILCPLYPHNNRSLKEELAVLMQKGFVRVEYQGKISRIESLLEEEGLDNTAWDSFEVEQPVKEVEGKIKGKRLKVKGSDNVDRQDRESRADSPGRSQGLAESERFWLPHGCFGGSQRCFRPVDLRRDSRGAESQHGAGVHLAAEL